MPVYFSLRIPSPETENPTDEVEEFFKEKCKTRSPCAGLPRGEGYFSSDSPGAVKRGGQLADGDVRKQ